MSRADGYLIKLVLILVVLLVTEALTSFDINIGGLFVAVTAVTAHSIIRAIEASK